jgi:uncharacterized protein (DUF58 family)
MFKDKNNQIEKIPAELFAKIRRIEIKSRSLVNEILSGNYSSVFRGSGMEFQEVREYAAGDDYRSIDWNVTARHSKPYVKRYREERQLNVMLLIDCSGSLEFGSTASVKSEKLAETASTIAFTAFKNQDKIGALFFTDIIEKVILPSKNKHTILRLIREILFIKPKHKLTNINTALEHLNRTFKRKGIIFILSDFYTNVSLKKMIIAGKKHDLIPIVFSDPFEEMPINVGLVDMLDNETNELTLVDTSSKAFIDSIKERKEKRESFFSDLRRNGIDPIFINTGDDIEKILVKYFQSRAKKLIL